MLPKQEQLFQERDNLEFWKNLETFWNEKRFFFFCERDTNKSKKDGLKIEMRLKIQTLNSQIRHKPQGFLVPWHSNTEGKWKMRWKPRNLRFRSQDWQELQLCLSYQKFSMNNAFSLFPHPSKIIQKFSECNLWHSETSSQACYIENLNGT